MQCEYTYWDNSTQPKPTFLFQVHASDVLEADARFKQFYGKDAMKNPLIGLTVKKVDTLEKTQ